MSAETSPLEQLIQARQEITGHIRRGEYGLATRMTDAFNTELTYRTLQLQQPEQYADLRAALLALITEVAKARDAVERDQAQRRGLL